MDDLVRFLRTQLDDDEREVNRHPIDGRPQLYSDDEREGEGFFATGESNYPCDSTLTVNKRFALADIEAKRRIIDKHARVLERDNWAWFAGSESESEWHLRVLAQPYAGREGWREEWRA